MSRRAFLRWLLGLVAGMAALFWGGTKLGQVVEGAIRHGDEKTGSAPQGDGPLVGSAGAKPVGGPQAEGALLSYVILSDLHVNSAVAYPSEHLKWALDDVMQFESKVEALVITGDLTESATERDYKELRRVLAGYPGLPPMFANMGNHEYYRIWINAEGAWSKETMPNGHTDAESRQAFLKFTGLKKPYSDTWLNGYHVILLSQETYVQEKPEVSEGAWYSDEQLSWLKAKLAEAKDGKPMFVMIHQPLPPVGHDGGAHQVIRAKAFRALLEPYRNVFLFWGHNHQDFQSGTPHYVKETFHGFNNSSVGRVLDRKYERVPEKAQGFYVEVFADRVRVRGREFSKRSWVKEADWTVSLKTDTLI